MFDVGWHLYCVTLWRLPVDRHAVRSGVGSWMSTVEPSRNNGQ